MKKTKKLLAFLLAFAIVLTSLVFASSAKAQTNEADALLSAANSVSQKNNYPFVFVHGLGGWGYYDHATEEFPYWGAGACMSEGNGDFVKFFRENGYKAYAASVGPINSAWDRACELYAQLTGTVVDYGEAHSKAHNHERYGRSFVGKPLMGEAWNSDEPINLIGHSFGGPVSRLFTSLMTYGDEAEIAATGESTSPLFKGGKSKAVHSVITLSGCHNGSPVANLLNDPVLPMIAIAAIVNIESVFSNVPLGFYTDLSISHFGLTPKEGQKRVGFSLRNILNYVRSKDHAGYDLTVGGSQVLNEKIKMSPDTYYYSVSGTVTEKNKWGRQEKTHDTAWVFDATTLVIMGMQGMTIDGIVMDESWANNDGVVPLASALYPFDEADNAFSYEKALEEGTIRPGSWYYLETMYGMDHGDYCGTADDYPDGYENFYLGLAEMVSAR